MSLNLFSQLSLKSILSSNAILIGSRSISACCSHSNQSSSSSRTAFQQREILDQLRGSSSSSSSVGTARQVDPNKTANETLRALSSGGLSGSMLGDSSLRMNNRGKGLTSRMTAEGKDWKEIGAGQKVARATLFSSRAVLVFGGATFTLILVYCLATELFSPNSPTVVYGEACKLVKASDSVAAHLLPPYRFHTSVSSISSTQLPGISNLPSRNGGRHQQVSSRMTYDSQGKEIMLLRFFLESRDKDRDLSILEKARSLVVENSSWIWERTKDIAFELRENWRENLADQDPGLREKLDLSKNLGSRSSLWEREEEKSEKNEGKSWGSFFSSTIGSFTSGLARTSLDSIDNITKIQPGTFSSGEVHGELIKDENGVLQWDKLFIDVPSSSATMRTRVWIAKKGDIQR